MAVLFSRRQAVMMGLGLVATAPATCSSGVIGDWESGVTNAAWDFTDWDFVDEALNSARADGSDTDYYVYVKWQDPCRMVVCHKENNAWVAIGGWYCAVGRRRYSDWVPRGCAGTFTISQRWWRSNTGPGCAMDYIECYTGDGTPGAWNNDSASSTATRGTRWAHTPVSGVTRRTAASRSRMPARSRCTTTSRWGLVCATSARCMATITARIRI